MSWIPIGFFAFILLFGILRSRQEKQKFAVYGAARSWEQQSEGTQWRMNFSPERRSGKRRYPSSLEIRSQGEDTGFHLFIYPETVSGKLFRALGFTQRVRTRNTVFDRHFHIAASDTDLASDFFGRGELETELSGLKTPDFRYLAFSKGELIYRISPVRLLGANPSVEDHASTLTTLLKPVLTQFSSVRTERNSTGLERLHGWHISDQGKVRNGFWVVIWIIAILGTVFAHNMYEPLHFFSSALLFVGYGSMLGVALLMAARGRIRSWSLPGQAIGPYLALGFMALLPISYGSAVLLNGALSFSPALTASLPVVSKRVSSSRRSANVYYVRAAGPMRTWIEWEKFIDFKFSVSDYQLTLPGKTQVDLTYHSGALGVPWIEHYALRF